MIQTPEQFAHTSYLKKSGQSAVQATCSLIKYSDTTLQTSRMFTGHWTSAVTGMPVNATNTQHTGQNSVQKLSCNTFSPYHITT